MIKLLKNLYMKYEKFDEKLATKVAQSFVITFCMVLIFIAISVIMLPAKLMLTVTEDIDLAKVQGYMVGLVSFYIFKGSFRFIKNYKYIKNEKRKAPG